MNRKQDLLVMVQDKDFLTISAFSNIGVDKLNTDGEAAEKIYDFLKTNVCGCVFEMLRAKFKKGQ